VSRTGVIVGAGNIGRGFIAQLFFEAGLQPVFVEVAPGALHAFAQRSTYTIHIVGEAPCDIPIGPVRVVDGRNLEEAAEAVAQAETAAVSVGAAALPKTAPAFAEALLRRSPELGPLNVLVCENLHDASKVLKSAVAEYLTARNKDTYVTQFGAVQAVVSRMVPLQGAVQKPEDLDIRVEAYRRLPVDADAVVGTLPEIPGVEPVANFLAYVERKLYTHNCAHAAIGYLGWQQQIEFCWQAMQAPAVRLVLEEAMRETGEALIRRHGFDPKHHAEHVADLFRRFENRALGDTCFRLARDPIRKLAHDDRLVGAARLCESQGVEPGALAEIIAAALRFDSSEDPAAVELQARIATEGPEWALREYAGIADDEPLGRAVLRRYLSGRPV
jgi:mannitol-1-phosphate 5-dehydrogenase